MPKLSTNTIKILSSIISTSALVGLVSTPSYAENHDGFFAELNTDYNIHSKKLSKSSGDTAQGDFSGTTLGATIGYRKNDYQVALSYSPEQALSLGQELAQVNSIKLSASKWFPAGLSSNGEFGVGAFISQEEFKLDIGENGRVFETNQPTADGTTYGLSLNYIYHASDRMYIRAGLDYAIESFDGSISHAGLESIEITEIIRPSINIGYRF